MKTLFYGQLDLTKLGDIARKNPELVKKVQFRDGREHQLLNVSILAKDEPDQYGKGSVWVKEEKGVLCDERQLRHVGF